MKSRLVFLLLAAQAGAALAQYKCTAADGAVTFQQTPCFGAGTEEKLAVVPNGHPPAASGVASPAPPAPPRAPTTTRPAASSASADKRMLANYRNQDNRDILVDKLRVVREDAAERGRQHDAEVAAAHKQYPNEADGQRLADAVSAVDSRYRAFSVIDERRIRDAQDAIDSWDRTQAASRRK